MTKKILAMGAAATLVLLATVGAFASQDSLPVLQSSSLEVVATDTATPDATETATPEGTATETSTPEATGTAEPTATGTVEPTATGTAEATATGTAEATATGTPSDATATPSETPTPEIHGIPDSNPVMHDDDGDGVCEKHETVVKTTPSGNQVRVPCQADKNNGQSGTGHGHGHGGNE